MADSATSTALVIAGRYLASPAALRARPEGPIDALDTRSGRTAQVRIVFASDGWDDDAFTDAVTRWCALACSEICGVLDFGEHEGRRFLVVAPSLGMSIERWQATRRPGPADAARLALAFGRLAERIAAAGFPVDACDLGDCAVGPGPTPVPGAAAAGLAGGQSDPGGAARRTAHAGCDPARRGWCRTGPTARGVGRRERPQQGTSRLPSAWTSSSGAVTRPARPATTPRWWDWPGCSTTMTTSTWRGCCRRSRAPGRGEPREGWGRWRWRCWRSRPSATGRPARRLRHPCPRSRDRSRWLPSRRRSLRSRSRRMPGSGTRRSGTGLPTGTGIHTEPRRHDRPRRHRPCRRRLRRLRRRRRRRPAPRPGQARVTRCRIPAAPACFLRPDRTACRGTLPPCRRWLVRYQPALAITPLISSAESARKVVVRRFPWEASFNRAAASVSPSGASTMLTMS